MILQLVMGTLLRLLPASGTTHHQAFKVCQIVSTLAAVLHTKWHHQNYTAFRKEAAIALAEADTAKAPTMDKTESMTSGKGKL